MGVIKTAPIPRITSAAVSVDDFPAAPGLNLVRPICPLQVGPTIHMNANQTYEKLGDLPNRDMISSHVRWERVPYL